MRIFRRGDVVEQHRTHGGVFDCVLRGGCRIIFFWPARKFLGAVQLMVYVGGTLVLLIFGVMLTARGPFVSMKTGGGQWILAIIIGAAMFIVLLQAALNVNIWASPPLPVASVATGDNTTVAEAGPAASESARLGLGLLGVRVDQLEEPNAALRQGMSGYLLVFEIVSIHLLVILVGSAYLARAKRRVLKEETP